MSASGSNAPVLISPACAQTIVGPSRSASAVSSSAGSMRPWSSVGNEPNTLGAEAEHAAGDRDRHVRLLAGDHAHRRRALQAVGLDVPAGVAQDRVARRRQAGEVRHLAARDEADAAAGREPEQVAHPAARRPPRRPTAPATAT